MKTPEQESRAIAERDANRVAAERGEALPFPNLWDQLDPTKVHAGASEEEVARSYAAFRAICTPLPRRRLTLGG